MAVRRRQTTRPTATETEALFREYRRAKDPAFRERLIMAHMNLVRFLARKFGNRGEPVDDLIQVGTIGLIHAIDRFDSDRGIRFATYATPTIVGEIKRYFRDRGWAIKVPRRLQEVNLAASKAMDTLTQGLERAPTVREIAAEIGSTEEETLEAMELGHMYELVSLDGEMSSDEDDSHTALSDYVGREDEHLEEVQVQSRLQDALSRLPPRERTIVRMRFFEGLPQTEVARRLGISQMHVSRLQHKALDRLREIVRNE
jgi:RNA polymerase sigma-B factor